MTHDLWTNLNKRMFEYLDSVPLGELVAQQKKPEATVLRDERPRSRARIQGIPLSA
jgi:Rrf2 family iron-sulfur cluster assembly transcriptional regulator